jgi:hypothetical protein
MGHNLCLDMFGGPSAEEARAGLTTHGEASVAHYEIDAQATALTMRADLDVAQLTVERRISLHASNIHVVETIDNLAACDRPIAWTEHVTLGPPFLQPGVTTFRASATRSRVYEGEVGPDDYLLPGAIFDWPMAPRVTGPPEDLRRCTAAPKSSAYTAHLMDRGRPTAFVVAFTPTVRLAFGYTWRTADFPWLGFWEENRSRQDPPWNGVVIARGMEFGVSPFPESRARTIDRGRMFDTPTYRWVPARRAVTAEYWIVAQSVSAMPESLPWPTADLGA